MKKNSPEAPVSPQSPVSNHRVPSLTNIVSWSQRLAGEVLLPGDLAVDLTAGKGRDTYALAKAVGLEGQVVAFDLQAAAIRQTKDFLRAKSLEATNWLADHPLPKQPGILLVQTCHSCLGKLIRNPAKAIMANLGYLPGGDQSIITRPESTLTALKQSLNILSPGGRLVVTVYPAHEGGSEESDVVTKLFNGLAAEQWQVLSLRATNHVEAPHLFAAERKP